MKLGCVLVLAVLAFAGLAAAEQIDVASDSIANRRLLQAGNGGAGGKGGKGGKAVGKGAVAGDGGKGGDGGDGGSTFGGVAGVGGAGGEGGDGGVAIGKGAIAGNGGQGGNGGNGGSVVLPEVHVKAPAKKSYAKRDCVTTTTTSSSTTTVTLLVPFKVTVASEVTAYLKSSISLSGYKLKSVGSVVNIGGKYYYPCGFSVPVAVIKQKISLTLSGVLVLKESKTISFTSTVKVCK